MKVKRKGIEQSNVSGRSHGVRGYISGGPRFVITLTVIKL